MGQTKEQKQAKLQKKAQAQRELFLKAAEPLIRYLNENCNPHVKVVVDLVSAELLEGKMGVHTEEFLKY